VRGARSAGAARRRALRAFALAYLVAPAAAAQAHEIAVPVRLDLAFLREALVEQVYREPGEAVRAFDDGVGCSWLELREPRVGSAGGRLRIVSRADARLGTPFLGWCLIPLRWRGFVEVFEVPRLEGESLVFEVVDSNLYDERFEKRGVRGRLWDLLKERVHPRLAAVRVDLAQPFDELRQWLPLVLPGSEARIARRVGSLRVRDPRVLPDAVGVTFAFEIEPRAAPAPAPEPALTPAELGRWESAWQRWDAFLTFVVKRFATDARETALRRAVLAALLDGRHDLLEALAPSRPGAPDPVPELFVRTWERLAPVLRDEARGLPAETALRYTAFLAAGDALAALQALGPEAGLEISAEGLRRLARMVAPAAPEDPVEYRLDVDPELRTLLGFGPPLAAPGTASEGEAEPEPAPLSGLLLRLLSSLVPAAHAALPPRDLARLNRWAPTLADRDAYLPLVRDLLRGLASEILAAGGLEARHHDLYGHLVLATAWQESCWRHFVREQGRLAPLRSSVGALGLMQVNPHVWRGAYDVGGLRDDIAYNGRAGSEILLHYLQDHALAKGEERHAGGADSLARASYAAYHGGPRHLTRYRTAATPRRLRRIDAAFWDKYQAVRAGRELEVARCFGP
jgi:soluble lytic murein transglycosylase-like protein